MSFAGAIFVTIGIVGAAHWIFRFVAAIVHAIHAADREKKLRAAMAKLPTRDDRWWRERARADWEDQS